MYSTGVFGAQSSTGDSLQQTNSRGELSIRTFLGAQRQQETWTPIGYWNSGLLIKFKLIFIVNIYYIQDGRLPPAYFAPSQFCKDAILKNENVYSSKNTLSSSNFLIFWTFKLFWLFLSKKPHNLGRKDLCKWYHSICILKQISYL